MTATARKIEAAATRLNFGCGAKEILDGFVNMDICSYPGVDAVCDVRDYAALLAHFQPGTLTEIYSSHVMEHFTGYDSLKVAQNLWDLAAPGCEWYVKVPHGRSDHYLRDPDHKRPFVRSTFYSFCQPYYERCTVPVEDGSVDPDMMYRGDWQVDTIAYVPEDDELELARADPAKWLKERAWKLNNCVFEMHALLRCVKPARERLDRLCDKVAFKVVTE